jgi:hypothetical protein
MCLALETSSCILRDPDRELLTAAHAELAVRACGGIDSDADVGPASSPIRERLSHA